MVPARRGCLTFDFCSRAGVGLYIYIKHIAYTSLPLSPSLLYIHNDVYTLRAPQRHTSWVREGGGVLICCYPLVATF
jgi:hypothetical protein